MRISKISRGDVIFWTIIIGICLSLPFLPSPTSDNQIKVQGEAKFGERATSTKVIEPDYSKIALKCHVLERLDKSPLNVCLGKFYESREPNQAYVMGQYFNASSTINISVPYDTDTMMHELYHAVDIFQPNRDDETQAYEFQSLFRQLSDKKLLYAD